MYSNKKKICISINGFNNNIFISHMIVLTKTFVLYEQLDLYIILKVTAAIDDLNLADLNCGTNLPQASHQAVLGILLFASVGFTNMG